jgi:hypothetical protein
LLVPVEPPIDEPVPVEVPAPVVDPPVVDPPVVDPPVLEPLPMLPGELVVPDVPPAALEGSWRQRSFSRPVSESQRAVPRVEPAAPVALEPFALEPPAPLPPLAFEPAPRLPPELLLVPPALPPALAPALPPALAPALPPLPPPDCATAVIAKSAAAVAVTKSFNFMWWSSCMRWNGKTASSSTQTLCH